MRFFEQVGVFFCKVSMPKVVTPQKNKPETLDRGDHLIIVAGVGITLALTLGFLVVMFGLSHYDFNASNTSANGKTVAIAPDYPRRLTEFSLTDQNGRTLTRKDCEGKFLVVGFVFTSCSITCPEITHQMEEIQALTATQPDIQLVTLTVDPDDDTVPVLKKYSSRYGADPGRWSFLTGDGDVMHRLISVSFLSPDTTSQFAYMPGNFAHIERIALVDPHGRIVRYFNGLNDGAADAVVAEIKRLKAASS